MVTMDLGKGHLIISVVVCTYNRSSYLRSCLQSLAEQTVDNKTFEVLVVDNNSSDNTWQIASGFVAKYSYFRLVFESCQGLSHARNRGWKEAHGQYVAYIDDDAIAYPDWISRIADFIERKPDVGIFGGPYDSFSLVPKPEWFPPEYGTLNLGDQERCIKLGCEWITGSNMVIRKNLFYKHGGFDVSLGMSGNQTAYGEEVNLFLFMSGKGIPVFYVPTIRVAHLVAEYKMNLNWLLISGYLVGRQYQLIFNSKKSLLSHLASLIFAVGGAVRELLRPVSMPFKRRLFYTFYRLYYEVGAVFEYCSTIIHKKILL